MTSYVPFCPFADWSGVRIGVAWEEFLAGLEAAKKQATQDEVSGALRFALRSAALETGAIEGLYTSTRGITRTVALQGAMWEVELV